MQPSRKIKLLMLGDSGVGKSSLVDRFTEDHFNLVTVRARLGGRWVSDGVCIDRAGTGWFNQYLVGTMLTSGYNCFVQGNELT